MKLSLRNIFGIITILCLALAILRRPLAYCLNSVVEFDRYDEMVQASIGPFWLDFYLLGIEKWFPYQTHLQELISFPALVVFFFSTLLSIVSHVLLLVYVGSWIQWIFFRTQKENIC